jgi:hypothetical protein
MSSGPPPPIPRISDPGSDDRWANIQDIVRETFATFSAVLSSQAAEISSLTSEVDRLRSTHGDLSHEVLSLNSRSSSFAAGLERIRQAVDAQSAELATVSATASKSESATRALRTDLAGIEEELHGTQQTSVSASRAAHSSTSSLRTAVEALEARADETERLLARKADRAAVVHALKRKAAVKDVTEALAGKAGVEDVNTVLAKKADASRVAASLDSKADAAAHDELVSRVAAIEAHNTRVRADVDAITSRVAHTPTMRTLQDMDLAASHRRVASSALSADVEAIRLTTERLRTRVDGQEGLLAAVQRSSAAAVANAEETAAFAHSAVAELGDSLASMQHTAEAAAAQAAAAETAAGMAQKVAHSSSATAEAALTASESLTASVEALSQQSERAQDTSSEALEVAHSATIAVESILATVDGLQATVDGVQAAVDDLERLQRRHQADVREAAAALEARSSRREEQIDAKLAASDVAQKRTAASVASLEQQTQQDVSRVSTAVSELRNEIVDLHRHIKAEFQSASSDVSSSASEVTRRLDSFAMSVAAILGSDTQTLFAGAAAALPASSSPPVLLRLTEAGDRLARLEKAIATKADASDTLRLLQAKASAESIAVDISGVVASVEAISERLAKLELPAVQLPDGYRLSASRFARVAEVRELSLSGSGHGFNPHQSASGAAGGGYTLPAAVEVLGLAIADLRDEFALARSEIADRPTLESVAAKLEPLASILDVERLESRLTAELDLRAGVEQFTDLTAALESNRKQLKSVASDVDALSSRIVLKADAAWAERELGATTVKLVSVEEAVQRLEEDTQSNRVAVSSLKSELQTGLGAARAHVDDMIGPRLDNLGHLVDDQASALSALADTVASCAHIDAVVSPAQLDIAVGDLLPAIAAQLDSKASIEQLELLAQKLGQRASRQDLAGLASQVKSKLDRSEAVNAVLPAVETQLLPPLERRLNESVTESASKARTEAEAAWRQLYTQARQAAATAASRTELSAAVSSLVTADQLQALSEATVSRSALERELRALKAGLLRDAQRLNDSTHDWVLSMFRSSRSSAESAALRATQVAAAAAAASNSSQVSVGGVLGSYDYAHYSKPVVPQVTTPGNLGRNVALQGARTGSPTVEAIASRLRGRRDSVS